MITVSRVNLKNKNVFCVRAPSISRNEVLKLKNCILAAPGGFRLLVHVVKMSTFRFEFEHLKPIRLMQRFMETNALTLDFKYLSSHCVVQ